MSAAGRKQPMGKKERKIGVGLIGPGVIGGQVARVLLEKGELLAERAGCPLVLRRVMGLPSDLERPLAGQLPPGVMTTDIDEFFAAPGMDIIVEVIGGQEPAREYQRRALAAGKHVVTANKEVIAKHGVELLALARRHGVSLNYEGSVGGGIPLIAPFKRDLVANKIQGIYAIINGTTNYILTRMAREGTDFAAALALAQELGYAEADPENDIQGIDAAYKLAILATLAFQTRVRPEDIHREGISHLSGRDFRYARELGFVIKLLAIAKQSDRAIEVRVHPVFLPEDSFLGKVDGVYNAVLVEGDLVGKVLFVGQGAGPLPTSSAVVADIISAARDIILGTRETPWQPADGYAIRPIAEIETRYYLRLSAADQPGVLAQIARVFGDLSISIASAIQQDTDRDTRTAEIVIMTHPAREQAMQLALGRLEKLSVVAEISNFIRVEDI